MGSAEDNKQPSPSLELLAGQRARDKANVAKWGLSILFFLFAILTIIIILTSQGIGINFVAPLAILGLAGVWFVGRWRGRQLYQRFFVEELSNLQQKPTEEAAAVIAHLTPREIQILNYAAQGYSNKLIAFELGISENTVKNFMSRVLSKLDANDRTQAAVIAIRHGLIPIK